MPPDNTRSSAATEGPRDVPC